MPTESARMPEEHLWQDPTRLIRNGKRSLSVAAILLMLLFPQSTQADSTYWAMQTVRRDVSHLGLTDCKASAFESISRLRAIGIPATFVAVLTESGAGHAIAVVDGKWALDNRYSRVVSIAELRRGGYRIAHLRGEP